jgi:hypothetical protein
MCIVGIQAETQVAYSVMLPVKICAAPNAPAGEAGRHREARKSGDRPGGFPGDGVAQLASHDTGPRIRSLHLQVTRLLPFRRGAFKEKETQ